MPDGVYYNDNDPFCCAWLRELIAAGLIPAGHVDERDIREVKADEVQGYRQWHFFVGIGGWPYALQLAGWDATRPVLTASCPCQPFSCAGRRQGEADERHLWPVLSALIRELPVDCCLGEQVPSRDGYEWLDGVRADLEAQGHAFGAADIPACSQGAPHIRNRLFWVASRLANASGKRRQQNAGEAPGDEAADGREGRHRGQPHSHHEPGGDGPAVGVEHPDSARPQEQPPSEEAEGGAARRTGTVGHPANCDGAGHQGERGAGIEGRAGSERPRSPSSGRGGSPWDDFRIILCRNGKHRRIPSQSALFPLAARLPGRVGLLRGAGNSIVPQTAAAFIHAFLEVEKEGR